ncbi:MAG: glycerophosphodiester phosphodiesterase family protein [bacterium]
MNTVKIDKYFKGMIAHRGLSGIETENTINAFIAAANRSYFGIECDVHATKDGKIIISHDDTLLRLGMLNLYIPSFRYDELRKFTLIDRKSGDLSENICIPPLTEFLQICRTYKKHAFIELKSGLSLENVDTIIAEIRLYRMDESVTLIAFDERYLTYIRKNHPGIDMCLLVHEVTEKTIDFCEKHQIGLDVQHDKIDEDTLKRMHLVGLKVAVWTVDDKAAAERLIKMGVDFITSNILE